jgi:hypothetical protein
MKFELTQLDIDIILKSLDNVTVMVKDAPIILALKDKIVTQFNQQQHEENKSSKV